MRFLGYTTSTLSGTLRKYSRIARNNLERPVTSKLHYVPIRTWQSKNFTVSWQRIYHKKLHILVNVQEVFSIKSRLYQEWLLTKVFMKKIGDKAVQAIYAGKKKLTSEVFWTSVCVFDCVSATVAVADISLSIIYFWNYLFFNITRWKHMGG